MTAHVERKELARVLTSGRWTFDDDGNLNVLATLQRIALDTDHDSFIVASADDQIDIVVGGEIIAVFDGSTATKHTTINDDFEVAGNATVTQILESQGGITGNGVEMHQAVMQSILGIGTLTKVTAIVSTTCYALYIGQARMPFTTAKLFANLTEVYTASGAGTYAEVGVASGSYDAEGAPSLTIRGYADVSATYNSAGRKTTSITCSGITAGMDLWIVYGFKWSTSPDIQLRGVLSDDLQTGVFCSATVQPQSISATTFAVCAANLQAAWLRLATRG